MMHRAHARYAAEGESALVLRHAALIDRVARRIAARTGSAVQPEDLWSAGAMGLLDAARRFDAARDVRFETFAEHRIRGAMLDELRRLDHLPRRLRDRQDKIEQARTRLEHTLAREPTVEELARATGGAVEDVDAALALARPEASALDALPCPLPGADDHVARGELAKAVQTAVERLPERQQLVLSLHYVEGLTYREIAKMLDVSEPRVCQLHGEAVAQLRAALRSYAPVA